MVIFSKAKFLLIILLFCIQYKVTVAATVQFLPQQQWAKPKRAETILAMPEIVLILQAMEQQPESHLLIRYPGGDEGTLWAHELRAWFVSFGLPSSMIEIHPGSSQAGVIEMQVQERLGSDVFQSSPGVTDRISTDETPLFGEEKKVE